MAGLGPALRAARERLNLTVGEAAAATRIRPLFVEALENERFDQLPPKAYAQGLLQVYARYLNVDPTPFLDDLPDEAEPAYSLPPPPSNSPMGRVLAGSLVLLSFTAIAVWAILQALSAAAAGAPSSTRSANATPTALVRFNTATPAPAPSPSASPTLEPLPGSASPQATATIRITSFVGQGWEQAAAALRAQRMIVLRRDEFSRDVPPDVVMAQSPVAGAQLAQGATITLVVSKGPEGILIPDVVGRQEGEARQMLTAAGLQVGRFANYQGRADLPDAFLRAVCVGCVLSTTPPARSVVQPTEQVFLAIRKE